MLSEKKEGDKVEGETDPVIAAIPAGDNTSPAHPSVQSFLDPAIAAPSVMPYIPRRHFGAVYSDIRKDAFLVPPPRHFLFCIASVLQAQMVEDYGASPEDKALHPIFNQRIEPAHGLGGDVSEVDAELLQREATEDEYLRDLLRSRAVPPVDVILSYVSSITNFSHKFAECNVVALVYLDRLNAQGRIKLTRENWRCVWVSCFMLAQKMWSDKPLKTSAFEKVCPPLTKAWLRELESYALDLLQCSVGVQASVYFKYYEDLRSLCKKKGFSETDWQFRPLPASQTAHMDVLCDKMSSHHHVSNMHLLKEMLERRKHSPMAAAHASSVPGTALNQEPAKKNTLKVERICKLLSSVPHARTVFATETILVPNLRQVIFCIASVLQAQMVEDYGASPEDKALHPIFNQRIEPAHGLGGDVSEVDAELLQREAPEDEYLRDLLRSRAVPPVGVILRFISCTTSYSQKSAECNIIALVYLNRMNALGRLVLTYENWRCVWVSCFMLAQKMWSDKPLKTSAFEKVCPPLTKYELRELESYAFKLLEYSTGVKPSVYVKYYFELRQLFTVSMGFSETDWQFRPLSTLQASRMTALYDRSMSSHRHVSKKKKKLLKEILERSSTTAAAHAPSEPVAATNVQVANDEETVAESASKEERVSESTPNAPPAASVEGPLVAS